MNDALVERLIVRVSGRLRALVDKAADQAEMSSSDWIRGALEQQAVREVEPDPRRHLGAQRVPTSLCVHPLTARERRPHAMVCGLCQTELRSL